MKFKVKGALFLGHFHQVILPGLGSPRSLNQRALSTFQKFDTHGALAARVTTVILLLSSSLHAVLENAAHENAGDHVIATIYKRHSGSVGYYARQ
ncbi:hypothetical protein [Roseovarius sp. MMSF_3281]|uniref:hypothetical protein n=1 Tax=Roseovarius sp. MMSF_3281 TaxID=3046694 RepID=UPI00273F3BBB|nr:hypothetical protein [Roseovarius sp. MMSF_3281]